jgi:hypothetical protein
MGELSKNPLANRMASHPRGLGAADAVVVAQRKQNPIAAQDSRPVQKGERLRALPGFLWFVDGLIRRKQDEAQQEVIGGAQSGHQPGGALKSGPPAVSGAGNMDRKLRKRSFCSLKRFFGNEV